MRAKVRDLSAVHWPRILFIPSDIEEVSERRKDPRIPYIARTQIVWDSPNGEVSLAGMIEDKSISGLGIEVSRAIPVGTSVRVKLGNQMISAVVRRCFKTGFSNFVGVSFEAPAAPTEAALPGPEYAAENQAGAGATQLS